MTPYGDATGGSGIAAYALGPGFIDVAFRDGGIYRYSARSVGAENLARMVQLARAGAGLNGFVNRAVWGRYERRLG